MAKMKMTWPSSLVSAAPARPRSATIRRARSSATTSMAGAMTASLTLKAAATPRSFASIRKGEPEIYETTRRFGTILENVVMDRDSRRIDLDDGTYTQNTRSSYPISHIPNATRSGTGRPPEERLVPHGRCFWRSTANQQADPRPGDVPLPQRLHGQGGGNGTRCDRSHPQFQRLLRRALYAAASRRVRQAAGRESRRA